MKSFAPFIDKTERVLSNNKLIVKGCILLRNRLNRIITYSITKDYTFETSGAQLLVGKIGNKLRNVIDIGANKGQWSEMIMALSPNIKKLMLIEPGKVAFSIIKSKFENDGRVMLVNCGVSDDEGMFSFNEGANASETSSFLPNSNVSLSNILTQVKRLDSILLENNLVSADFVKIDCEGFDFKVLNGATNHLQSRAFGVIQFEYDNTWIKAGSTLTAAFNLLTSYGYKVYLLSGKGLTVHDINYYQEHFGYSNFVAVSPDWFEHVRDLISD